MVENLAMLGRKQEVRELFLGLLAVRNDARLLAKAYDPAEKQLRGIFPQAFSHVGLIPRRCRQWAERRGVTGQ